MMKRNDRGSLPWKGWVNISYHLSPFEAYERFSKSDLSRFTIKIERILIKLVYLNLDSEIGIFHFFTFSTMAFLE